MAESIEYIQDFESRKDRAVLDTMLVKLLWFAGFVGLVIWGQNFGAQSKLYFLFATGLVAMLADLAIVVWRFTKQELRRCRWYVVIPTLGVGICVWMLWMSYAYPPKF